MIRIIVKSFAIAVALTASLHVGPVSAAAFVYVSSTGSDVNPCTALLPCATFFQAAVHVDNGGQINCINSPGVISTDFSTIHSLTIDCAGVFETTSTSNGGLVFTGAGQVVKIRNLTISGATGGNRAIKVTGSGTLILENCVFENISGAPALDIEADGSFNLVVTNSRISNSGAGVFIKPTPRGSVTATFDGVTIANNSGGGVKTDSTQGLVTVNISNSTITKNAGNGVNAVSGVFREKNMLNLSHVVIAGNGAAGVQANGAIAAVSIDTTLLDSNTIATSAINGGRLLTYGNNRIVGTAGSGFTGAAPLQ